MSDLTLEGAYDAAFAVFSPRVQFVEWRMFEVQSDKPGGWWPYWRYRGERLWDTWKEIDGNRWIYAFRRYVGQGGAAVLVGEFFLDTDKQLYATPMAEMRHQADASHGAWPERVKHSAHIPSQRPAQVPIGTTVSFIRQFKGKPLEHFFFSSRVQLPSKLIAELQFHIMDWTPAVTFVPYDPNVVSGSEGQPPSVPVLDPITIALHLHAYFNAACVDLYKYLTPVDDPSVPNSESDKNDTVTRQKKLVLAQLINAIINADRTLVGIDDENQLYNFLRQHDEQVSYREGWRERWGTYLSNWLKARPYRLVAEAYAFDEKEDFHEFLTYDAFCQSGLNASESGRQLLNEHLDQPAKFPEIHKYVLAREFPTDVIQIARKVPSAILEYLKEHAPSLIAKGPLPAAEVLKKALENLFSAKVKPIQILTFKNLTPEYRGWLAWMSDLKGGGADKFVPAEEVELVQIEITIEQNPQEIKESWKGSLTKIAALIELVNFALALHGFAKKQDAKGLERGLAYLELTGAGLDLTNTALQVFKKGSKKTLATLTFVSAVIDTFLGVVETGKALSETRFGKAVGSTVVTFGSAVIAIGVFAEGSLAGPIGLAIVAIGYTIKFMFRDPTEYENLVHFSAFGAYTDDSKYIGHEVPEWYETKKSFSQWSGDLDEQLRATVGLLSRFKIEPAGSNAISPYDFGQHGKDDWRQSTEAELLRGEINMSWTPKGCKLYLELNEEWTDDRDSRKFTATVQFDDTVSVIESVPKNLVVVEDNGKKLKLQAPGRPPGGQQILHWGPYGGFAGVNKNLKRITLNGSLVIELAGVVCRAKPIEEGTLYEPRRGMVED